MKAKRKAVKRHWYRMHFGECPVCGKDKSYRERVYGRKPSDKRKCVVYLPDSQTYDHCVR